MRFADHAGEIEIIDGAVKIKSLNEAMWRTIYFSDIIFVALIKPRFIMTGGIHIQVVGAPTYLSSANTTHYALDINTVFFRRPKYEEAVRFKEALDKAIADSRKSNQIASGASGSGVDMEALKQLKQLLDEGVITQEDYDRKKSQILGL